MTTAASKFYSKSGLVMYPVMHSGFVCQFDTGRVIREEGVSLEEMLLGDPAVRHSLNY